MGASSSTNTNTSSNTAPIYNNFQKFFNQSPSEISEEPSSLSIVLSTDSYIDESVTQRIQVLSGEGDKTVGEGVLTLWKPTESEDLLKDELDQLEQSHSVYISGSATFNLDSNRRKKKRCHCFCCKRRKRRRRSNSGSRGQNNSRMESDSQLDEYDTQEVISLQSAEEIVIIPTEVFPLEMVATLEMTREDVKAKPKKVRRTRVPEKPDKPLSLWALIKSSIGKDLTKLPLPVNFSEPLSMLQRLAEDYEYSSILDRASRISDSCEQLTSVAAFAISSYASTAVRTAKPFNPLLGETFEFDRTDDMGWRCVAEQVCHHPPIAALHCDSAFGWVHWQQFTMKSSFKGTCLEIDPLGVSHLRFKASDNHYTLRKVSTLVKNLYMGKLYIEQDGEMDIINHTTNEICHLKFSSGGMFSRDRSVTGKVYNRANEAKWEINGTWDKDLRATKLDDRGKPIGDSKLLWQNNPLPPDAEKRYMFSYFACQLNEPEDDVAPTDSRNRPDQRFMENGLWDEANVEKQRLEDKQRDVLKARLAEGATKHSTSSKINNGKNTNDKYQPKLSGPEDGVEPFYTPCWFTRQRDPVSGQCIYMFNGDYWDRKESKDWGRCPSIYNK